MWRSGALALIALALAGCASRPPEATSFGLQRFERLAEAPAGEINADVTQASIKRTICVSGWTATVRPATSYTNPLKARLLQERHLSASDASRFELDHFIPLALGGHPTSHDNLWLQPWEGQWGAKTKDRLERKLQLMVCAGQLTLDQARSAIRTNWVKAFETYVGDSLLLESNERVE